MSKTANEVIRRKRGGVNNSAGGAAKAERQLTTGEQFQGLALEMAKKVDVQLAQIGSLGMLKEGARRFEVVSQMYFGLILACDNEERMNALTYRWSSLQAHACRQWLAIVQEEKRENKGLTAEQVLSSIRVVQDDRENN